MIRTIKDFDTLYRRFAPLAIRRSYLLLRDEDDARDCVQQAFMSLWDNRADVRNPEAYMHVFKRLNFD